MLFRNMKATMNGGIEDETGDFVPRSIVYAALGTFFRISRDRKRKNPPHLTIC